MTGAVYYPVLPGLGYSVIKRPRFFNAVATSASGVEVRVSYSASPVWEWDLIYDYLPDHPTASASTASDFKELIGFYLAQQGSLDGFMFLDPDDNAVTAQYIAAGDGVTYSFTIQRSYGGSHKGTEPVGYVSETAPLAAYVNGASVSFSVDRTLPGKQMLVIFPAPALGAVITMDVAYYYYVRFKDDTIDFEKFMDRLWLQQTLTLISLRTGPAIIGGGGI